MKNLRMLMAVGVMSLLTACGGTKNTTANPTSEKDVVNRGRSNTEINATTGTARNNNEVSTGRAPRTATANRSDKAGTTADASGAKRKAKMAKMYSELNMSEAQISQFETEWRRANRGKTMNNFERMETQDSIMKDILDAAQFEKYQQWARDNAATLNQG